MFRSKVLVVVVICALNYTKNNKTQQIKYASIVEPNDAKSDGGGHIMISYNWSNQETCVLLKSELERLGLRVWIDVEDMSGSSLGSMAHAIERSSCVLICMSEKYKSSANCRAEAEYAFQLRKPIIPLIMQKGYQPDGKRTSFDFTSHYFS